MEQAQRLQSQMPSARTANERQAIQNEHKDVQARLGMRLAVRELAERLVFGNPEYTRVGGQTELAQQLMRDKDYASAEKVWNEEIEMLERHRNRLNALAEIVPVQHRITALRTDLVPGSISSETELQLRQAQEQVNAGDLERARSLSASALASLLALEKAQRVRRRSVARKRRRLSTGQRGLPR